MGQTIYFLALPNLLGMEVLQKLHYTHDTHLTAENLLKMSNQKFYTPGANALIKKIIQKCIMCRLNKNKYSRSTSDCLCENQDELIVGKEWQTDIAHLPRSKGG